GPSKRIKLRGTLVFSWVQNSFYKVKVLKIALGGLKIIPREPRTRWTAGPSASGAHFSIVYQGIAKLLVFQGLVEVEQKPIDHGMGQGPVPLQKEGGIYPRLQFNGFWLEIGAHQVQGKFHKGPFSIEGRLYIAHPIPEQPIGVCDLFGFHHFWVHDPISG